MGFQSGIVGLPNVGKSTIFNALTSAKAEAANFPFCTIEPNTGMVKVPDKRLDEICKFIPPQKVIPAAMTFVDIAGIVKGASKGEGLGNKFLSHIREVNTIVHVVRCFDDPDVVHVDGSVDPLRDVSVIDTELMLADLETVGKKYTNLQKQARAGVKEASILYGVLDQVKTGLEAGTPIRSLPLSKEQIGNLRDFHFLTLKKVMYVANVSDTDLAQPDKNENVKKLMAHAKAEGSSVVVICGKIEAEIAELESEDEKLEFLKDYDLTEPGLNRVIRTGYDLLGLQTYFTAGEKEVRAWTVKKGALAPEAAGVIHSDFEKGFIKAEVYHYDDLMKHQSEAAIRDAGAMRLEGKEYAVKDGDIMHFRFSS